MRFRGEKLKQAREARKMSMTDLSDMSKRYEEFLRVPLPAPGPTRVRVKVKGEPKTPPYIAYQLPSSVLKAFQTSADKRITAFRYSST